MKGHIRPGRVVGTWYLRVELDRAPSGQRRQRRETIRGTKADAQRRLRDLLREVERGNVLDRRSVFAVVCAGWLDAKRDIVEPRTFERYEAMARKYIVPMLGGMLVEKIRPSDVQRAMTYWRNGLSARGIAHVLGELRAIFAWAIKMELVFANPAAEWIRRVRSIVK